MVYCFIEYEIISFLLNMFMLGCEVIIFLDVMYEMFFDIKDILVS